MSKLIKIYESLKEKDNETMYLFKSGIFYIFLDEDAKKMSENLGFKITNLNQEHIKCGFPSNSFDKYMSKIEALEHKVQIVNPNNDVPYTVKNFSSNLDIQNLLNEITSVDVKQLSVRDAYSFIDKIQVESKILLDKGDN